MTAESVRRFMAYDEGCYECGEPSGVIGFYDTETEAVAAVERAELRQKENWQGQHWMHVIDLWNPEMSAHSDGSGE